MRHTVNAEVKVFESEDAFAQRIEGIMTLYGAIVQVSLGCLSTASVGKPPDIDALLYAQVFCRSAGSRVVAAAPALRWTSL